MELGRRQLEVRIGRSGGRTEWKQRIGHKYKSEMQLFEEYAPRLLQHTRMGRHSEDALWLLRDILTRSIKV